MEETRGGGGGRHVEPGWDRRAAVTRLTGHRGARKRQEGAPSRPRTGVSCRRLARLAHGLWQSRLPLLQGPGPWPFVAESLAPAGLTMARACSSASVKVTFLSWSPGTPVVCLHVPSPESPR